MYEARKNGQLVQGEGRIPAGQLKASTDMANKLEALNSSYREKIPKMENYQVEAMARKGRNLLMTRRNHWLPLSSCAQPIVLEREQYELYDDVLSVCKPKLIYTIVGPDSMTLDETAMNLGTIKSIKSYELAPGDAPVIPTTNYTLDISKDFAPAYVRTGVLSTVPHIRNKDATHSYVRAQVVANDQQDVLSVRADFLVNEKQLPETYSLAQDLEAESRIMCHAQILHMSAKEPLPTEDAIRQARILSKNIIRRDLLVKEREGVASAK